MSWYFDKTMRSWQTVKSISKFENMKLTINDYFLHEEALSFCNDFLHGENPKYLFGRNKYAESIAGNIDIDGFVDDFTSDTAFLGKPVIKTEDLPENAMVVSVVAVAKPITARNKLAKTGVRQIDYFLFRKYSGMNVIPVMGWWDDFKNDFEVNREKYDGIYGLLQEERSKSEWENIINFRLSDNIQFLESFSYRPDEQYFEDFLGLQEKGETFIDVGGFDGYTSLEFIKRCPGYDAVHIFEPDPDNMALIKANLAGKERVFFHQAGASNQSSTLRFETMGSSSKISNEGNVKIKVEKLDEVLDAPFSFLKMDIEGEELSAIQGAERLIRHHHPRLAICVYHRFDDLWKIPEQVLSYYPDYKIFLRHYTEGIEETVMFFIPPDTVP